MDEGNPTISVVIPTYRRPLFLKRAIRSVLAQDYPHFRIKVFDNNSGDNTREIVARFNKQDSRVEYYCRERNIGPVQNILLALEDIDTPLFTCLSDDDIAIPDFFSTAVENFNKYPDSMFSGGACLGMSMDGHIHSVMPSGWEKKEGYFKVGEGLAQMIKKNPLQNMLWTSLIFKTELFQKIGGIDPDLGLPIDIDFIYRSATRFPFVMSRKPLAIFTFHGQNWTYTVDSKNLCESWSLIFEKLLSDPNLTEDLKKLIRKRYPAQLAGFIYNHAVKSLVLSKVDRARELGAALKDISPAKSWWIRQLIKSHQNNGWLYKMFLLIRERDWVGKDKGKKLDKKFASYLDYFNF